MVLCDLFANVRNGFIGILVAGWWIQLAHWLHVGVRLLINVIYYNEKKTLISLYGIMSMRAET